MNVKTENNRIFYKNFAIATLLRMIAIGENLRSNLHQRKNRRKLSRPNYGKNVYDQKRQTDPLRRAE
jgi:hypothetical protein